MGEKGPRDRKPHRETDLYEPVRDYLVEQGYTVRSEVLGCDIAATKGDDLILIELKRRFSLELLMQAVQRQKIADSVYVAVPRPDTMTPRKRLAMQHLLRRLEIGLIFVSTGRRRPGVEVAFHPLPFDRKKQSRKRRAVLQEIAGRSGEHNVGGSARRKLVTAYRENALRIAYCLQRFGPQSPKALRALGAGPKTHDILYHNVYGWFERIERGIYALTASGAMALAEYTDITMHFAAEMDHVSPQ